MRTVYADDRVEIVHQQGDGARAIVSFTGIGYGTGALQTHEFRKSLQGFENDLYFVKDLKRHWYNDTYDQIADLLNADFAARGIGAAVTLGNSMGGFGAIIFAGRLTGCRLAIAFAAQSCVDPAILPWPSKWHPFTRTIETWRGLDAIALLSPSVDYHLFFGLQDEDDAKHAARFAALRHPRLHITTVPQSDHNVSQYLRSANHLRPILARLLGSALRSQAVQAQASPS